MFINQIKGVSKGRKLILSLVSPESAFLFRGYYATHQQRVCKIGNKTIK